MQSLILPQSTILTQHRFLDALKTLFPNGKQLTITVEQEEEDIMQFIENRPTFKKQLDESIEAINRGEIISFESIEELQKKLDELNAETKSNISETKHLNNLLNGVGIMSKFNKKLWS